MKRPRWLSADPAYRERLERYTLRDALAALLYYLGILAAYYAMGRALVLTGRYYGVPVNLILMLIPVLLCRGRMASIGLSPRNLRPALVASGLIGGVFLLAYTIIPGIVRGAKLLPLKTIAYNVFYYFVVIGLSEEISFRGFIQPRLYPLLKREWLVVLVGGVLFVGMHYPFQMAARNMTFGEYWPLFISNAPMQLLWHLAFTWLYRRYGNLYGSAVLHGCVDMCSGIFA